MKGQIDEHMRWIQDLDNANFDQTLNFTIDFCAKYMSRLNGQRLTLHQMEGTINILLETYELNTAP